MPNNATPLISVIVPVYNAEDYLRYCIDSILQQSYTNLEVILVDDGAKDSSPAICDEYATQDSRVTVIHQENGGIAKAQNTGLDAAHGEYIAFSDNDDILNRRTPAPPPPAPTAAISNTCCTHCKAPGRI